MKKIFLLAIFFLLGCSNTKAPGTHMSKKECEISKKCTASGMLEMSSDGHAFIGKLILGDGSCINVSLSDSVSKSLLGKSESYYVVHGFVFPYPASEDILRFEVNGRDIGFGLCGPFYIFVK